MAVFDWEMATLGDPLMDLGTTLGYWVEAGDPAEWREHGFGLTALPGNLTRMELARRYEARTGRAVDRILFDYVYALFKIAVIIQQIFKRYVEGHSRDPRFASLGERVRGTAHAAIRALDSGRLSAG